MWMLELYNLFLFTSNINTLCYEILITIISFVYFFKLILGGGYFDLT